MGIAIEEREVTSEGRRVLSRLGGITGIVFAVGVTAQNAVLLSDSPLPGADLEEIGRFYADGQGRISIAVGLVAFNIVCLLLFASAAAEELSGDPEVRIAGRAGFGAAVLLAGAFLTTTAIQAVLAGRVDDLAASGDLEPFWDLHTAAFAMSASSLAVAIGSFSLGALLSGRLVPRWVAIVGLAGAAASMAAGGLVVSSIDGGAGVHLQLIGFVTWLVFLFAASVRLLRSS